MKQSFFVIYDLGLKRKRWSCVKLSKELAERGVDVSCRSLQRYRIREMRPTPYIAGQIFDCLDINASEDEVLQCLEVAREEKIRKDTGNRYIERGFRIPVRELDPTSDNVDDIKARFDQRVMEVEGNLNVNKYVTELIREDMKNNILKKK